LRYFGSLHELRGDPAQDPDGDGLTNLEEFRAGTNPLDATSGLRLSITPVSPFSWRIRFATVAGKSYRIERSTNLSPQEWTTVTDNLIGTGEVIDVIDHPAGAQLRGYFYRALVTGP
jgi:hypothetical protein